MIITTSRPYFAPYPEFFFKAHLDSDLFKKAGIELRPVNPHSPVYPQLWGNFIPDLTAFDLLFNCGPKARDILLVNKCDFDNLAKL